jgi:hypothetical protein
MHAKQAVSLHSASHDRLELIHVQISGEILCRMLGNLLEKRGLEVDPMMIEHMESILMECTLEERRDALEPFLLDAGCEDIDEFLEELTMEVVATEEQDAKQLSIETPVTSKTALVPARKAEPVTHKAHKTKIKAPENTEKVEEMVQEMVQEEMIEESDYQKMLQASTTMAIGKRTKL